jgi:hypothetical protein
MLDYTILNALFNFTRCGLRQELQETALPADQSDDVVMGLPFLIKAINSYRRNALNIEVHLLIHITGFQSKARIVKF